MIDTSLSHAPEVATAARNFAPRYRVGKRVFDIVGASVGIVVLGPLMLIVAGLIAAKDGFPVLFRQNRIGFGGRPFRMIKFRSMLKNAEQILRDDPKLMEEYLRTYKLENDPRITPLGKFIRKTSIDELPQLFNVLRGEMSLVGPRPIVEKEIEHYGDDAWVYKAVKPGCAGLWQCSGRSDTSYPERVALDIEYYRKAGLRTDLKILLRTCRSIVRREGAR